jgi:hypothetical protein
MSTQNAKRMTTLWDLGAWVTPMANLSAKIPPLESAFICRWVSGTRSRSASAKAAAIVGTASNEAVCRDMLASAIRTRRL